MIPWPAQLWQHIYQNWTETAKINVAQAQEARQIPTAFHSYACGSLASAPHRSTETMLARVTNGLYIAGANGPFYVIISLDFCVTLDTLSHLLFLKIFFFSSCDILSLPSSLGILFQAPFSLHAPHILVCCPALAVPT